MLRLLASPFPGTNEIVATLVGLYTIVSVQGPSASRDFTSVTTLRLPQAKAWLAKHVAESERGELALD